MQADLKDLSRKIVSYTKKQGYDKANFPAYQILKRIDKVYKELIKEIEDIVFRETKYTDYSIDEGLKELEEGLE